MDPDPFMTIDDLASWLRVPVQTVYDWRRRAYGPRAYKIGGQLRWRRRDVEEWLEGVAEQPGERAQRRSD